MYLGEMGGVLARMVVWINLAQDRYNWQVLVNAVMNLWFS